VGAVDAALKSMRTAVIGFLTALCFINPKYSAFLSLIIIVMSYSLQAGRSASACSARRSLGIS